MSIGQVVLAVSAIWLLFNVAPTWSAALLPRWTLLGLCCAALIGSFLPTFGGIPIFTIAVLAAAIVFWAYTKTRGEVWRLLEAAVFAAVALFLVRLYLQDELVYSFVRPEWMYGLLAGFAGGIVSQHVRAAAFGAPLGVIVGEAAYWFYMMMVGGITPLWSARWVDALVIAALSGMVVARLLGWTNWGVYKAWRAKQSAKPHEHGANEA